MSEVSNWIAKLGKSFSSYPKIFEENGIDDLSMIGILEISDMSGIGINRVHAKVIYHRYRRDFPNAIAVSLKPSMVKSVQPNFEAASEDEEKISAEMITLLRK